MTKLKLKLNTVEQVQQFITIMWNIESDAVIRSEDRKYAVDAKSIMGIYSLDLSKFLVLEINGDDDIFDLLLNVNIISERIGDLC